MRAPSENGMPTRRPGFVSVSGALWGALAVAAVLIWALLAGAIPFSAGSLNASVTGPPLGGVSNHAQIGTRCGACHTAPWAAATMADRCIACHADVGTQIQGHNGLHGGLLGALSVPSCGSCHSEHDGPNGSLNATFDHNALSFKLVGKHANVPCASCHTHASSLQDLRNTPQDCYSCHAKDDRHNGTFGRTCGQCHTPASWANATFDHTIFPVDHGGNPQGACSTCHPSGVTTYTCFGCHRHDPANVQRTHEGRSLAQLANCVACHSGGRQGGD
jgi:hypothetical protein